MWMNVFIFFHLIVRETESEGEAFGTVCGVEEQIVIFADVISWAHNCSRHHIAVSEIALGAYCRIFSLNEIWSNENTY